MLRKLCVIFSLCSLSIRKSSVGSTQIGTQSIRYTIRRKCTYMMCVKHTCIIELLKSLSQLSTGSSLLFVKTEWFVLQCRGCSCLGAKHFLCKKLNWDVQKESFAHDVIAFVLSQGIRTVCLFFLVEFAECVAKSKVPQQTDTTTLCATCPGPQIWTQTRNLDLWIFCRIMLGLCI